MAVETLPRDLPLFATLNASERLSLVRITERWTVEEGQPVFRRGELRQALVVVLKGRLRVVQTFNNQPETLAQLGPGSFIGEQALVNPTQLHEYSAMADLRSDLLLIPGAAFLKLRRSQPHLAVKLLSNILAVIADRLSHADTKLLTLYTTGKIATLAVDLHELTALVLQTILHTLRARLGVFVTFDPEADQLIIRQAVGYRRNLRGVRLPLRRDPLLGRLYRSRETIVIDRQSYHRDPHWKTPYAGPGVLAMPVTVGQKIIGAILVADKRGGQDFSVNNQLLLSIVARQIAVAIAEKAIEEEKHLVEELERVYIKPL